MGLTLTFKSLFSKTLQFGRFPNLVYTWSTGAYQCLLIEGKE